MYKLFVIFILVFKVLLLYSQELPLQQYYLLNPILLNPATAGFTGQIDIRASFARQWMGITNAPSTQTLAAHSQLGKGVGLGGYFFNDVNGLNRETGILLAGAYHIKLGDEREFLKVRQLSFGMGITGFQHTISLSGLTPHDYDPAVDGAEKKGTSMEFSTGVFSRYDRIFAGISIARLGAGKLSVYNDATEPEVPVFIALNAGYDFPVSEKLIVEPSALYKLSTNHFRQIDLNVKGMVIPDADWQYWLTLSLRNGFYTRKSSLSDLVILLGLNYRGLMLNYGYDICLTGLAKSHSGSHQLLIGIQIPKSRQHRLICPIM